MIRTYSELTNLLTFEERFEYLKLEGVVGRSTFGFDRWINQQFYTSREWKQVRTQVIARDMGYDLGIEGFEIHEGVYIHHMNPMTPEDIYHNNEDILNPEFLISCSLKTHNAIHYGDERMLPKPFIERRAGDTTPWR